MTEYCLCKDTHYLLATGYYISTRRKNSGREQKSSQPEIAITHSQKLLDNGRDTVKIGENLRKALYDVER